MLFNFILWAAITIFGIVPLQASQISEEFEQKTLASQTASTKSINPVLNQALFDAVGYNDAKKVEELLSEEEIPDVNAKDNDGKTALMSAAQNGETAIVHALIGAGSDVNVRSNGGSTALMWAVQNVHIAIVQTLIGAGANVNVKNNNGDTPLMWAAPYNFASVVIQPLIDAGANVNAKDNKGNTALTQAAHNINTAAIQLLIRAGANPMLKNEEGQTALMIVEKDIQRNPQSAELRKIEKMLQDAEKDWKKVISAQRMNLPEKIFESENLFGKQGKGGTTHALGKEVSEYLGVSKVPTIKVPHSTISQKEWLRLQVLYDLAHKNQLTPGIEMKEFKQLVETIDREVKAKRAFATQKQWKLLNAAMVARAELSLRMHA